MPYADPMLVKFAGAKIIFNIEITQGYWQLPLFK